MASRTRKTSPRKTSEDAVASVVDEIANRVERAVLEVERALQSSGREWREALPRAEDDIRQRGFTVPVLTPSESAAHAGVAHPHETLCVAPRTAIAAIRGIAARVREIDAGISATGAAPLFSTEPISLRAKAPRKGEPIDVEGTIAALSEWGTEHGMGEASQVLESLAYEHLHIEGTPSAQCVEVPCQRLAVCRALADLLDARDASSKRAVRELAQALFDAGGDVAAVARRFAKTEALKALASDMTDHLAPTLGLLGEQIRALALSAPADVAPRGEHAPATLLLSVSQHLLRGNFDDAEIAKRVLVKGETEQTRLKNTRRRLQRYRGRDFRTRYSKTPDA